MMMMIYKFINVVYIMIMTSYLYMNCDKRASWTVTSLNVLPPQFFF